MGEFYVKMPAAYGLLSAQGKGGPWE